MKAYRGSGGIIPLIVRRRSAFNFMAWPLYAQEEPQYLLNRRLGGPHSWSGCFKEEDNLLLLPELKPQRIQPVP
jgi:hypothetical protein